GPTARAFARRLDHSAIFVATASFYTPFCIGVLPPPWGIPLLAVVWTLAALGVALRCFWLCAPRGLVMATYLGVGWLAAVATTQLARELPTDGFVLLVGAGVAYSTGALCFAARWPNPAPRFIGHHELFH